MENKELIDRLNNALYDERDGKHNTYYIQTTLTEEQWKQVAPYMSDIDYDFTKLFGSEEPEDYNNLADMMVHYASFIEAVLIDPTDTSCVNVVIGNGCFGRENSYKEKYYVVNV